AARLKIGAVAAGGDLAVLPLPRQPHLEVVGTRGTEADVARAQGYDAERKLEALQYRLGMRREFLQCPGGVVGPDHVHKLYLLELVLANHPARVLAVGAGLGTEAGCMGDIAPG